MQTIFGSSSNAEDNEWISFSDLMAVLMVMFLFIAVIYFKRADVEILREEKVKIESEKTKLNNMKSSLEADLEKHKDDISALELKKREVENLLDQAKISLEEKTLLVNSAKKRAANERQKILNIELNLKKTLENQRIVITNFQSFQLVQNEIFEALKEEFENDLTRWQAELTKDDLAIRFLPLMYYLRQENLL
jgi:chromosome segregation ATPase